MSAVTIAISVKVHDGVVLAADSASTLFGFAPGVPPTVMNVYNNANKIRRRPHGNNTDS